MKSVFFITSSGSIYRRALPLIDQKSKDGEVLVVTSNDNTYKFFTNYTPFKTIQSRVNPNLIAGKDKIFKLISNVVKSKFEYRKLFKDIKGSNIYFFNTGNTIVTFSYIQKLAKHNKIFFYSSEKDKLDKQIKPTIFNSWYTKVVISFIKLTLGIDIKVRKDCHLISLCVYKEFFAKNNITDTYQEFDQNIYKKYMKKIDLVDKKVLVLWSDLVSEGRIDEKTFTEQSNQLIQLLKEYYPNKYIIKAHPNMSMLYGLMVNQPQLESYVPSQFFMYHPWKIVIADCSAALVFPEEQNLTKTKLIEMVDILKFKDSKVQKELKQFLISWNPKLLFPQSFKELERMLK